MPHGPVALREWILKKHCDGAVVWGRVSQGVHEYKKGLSMFGGGPAFPCHTNPRPGTLSDAPQGMTLRDYFAAAAMAGYLQDRESVKYIRAKADAEGISPTDYLAGGCYEMADAMLKERNRVDDAGE